MVLLLQISCDCLNLLTCYCHTKLLSNLMSKALICLIIHIFTHISNNKVKFLSIMFHTLTVSWWVPLQSEVSCLRAPSRYLWRIFDDNLKDIFRCQSALYVCKLKKRLQLVLNYDALFTTFTNSIVYGCFLIVKWGNDDMACLVIIIAYILLLIELLTCGFWLKKSWKHIFVSRKEKTP